MMASAHSNENWIVIMESSIPARVKRFVFVSLTWILHLSFSVYHDVYYLVRLFPGLSTQWQLCSFLQECIVLLLYPGITYRMISWMWRGILLPFRDTGILQRFALWLQITMDLIAFVRIWTSITMMGSIRFISTITHFVHTQSQRYATKVYTVKLHNWKQPSHSVNGETNIREIHSP